MDANVFVNNHFEIIPVAQNHMHRYMYDLLHGISPNSYDDLHMLGVYPEDELTLVFSEILGCLSFKTIPLSSNNFQISISDKELNVNYNDLDINFTIHRYPYSIAFGGPRQRDTMKDIIKNASDDFVNILNNICDKETIKYNELNKRLLDAQKQNDILVNEDFNF